MMNRKGKVAWVLTAGLTMAAAGCGGGSAENGTTAADEETASLRLAMTTFAGYGLWYLADEQGYFEDNGVDVELTLIEDKDQTSAAFASGRINGWVTTVDTFLYYDAEEIGAVQVMVSNVSDGADGVVATNNIETVADLEGESVGVQMGSVGYFFLLNALNGAGLTEEDIEVNDMSAGDAGAAFVSGHVDAAATWQPWLDQASTRGHVLTSTADVPGLVVDTLAISKEDVENSPQMVTGVIQSYYDAYEFWAENQEEAIELMAKSSELSVSELQTQLEGVKFANAEESVRYFGTDEEPGQIYDVIETGAAIYQRAGLIDQEVNPDAIVDPTFIQELG